ncbi:rhodanese-like domain-containing protein [Myxococcota bacterium]|nr:rhodanese-like domain-containing protein [Myxococcota bacterium]
MIPFAVEAWQLLCGEVQPGQVVDLRQPDRFARGHLPGAQNLPYERLQAEAATLDRTRSVLLVDPAGARAAELATWLRARGYDAGYLEGGIAAWTGPLERP